MASALDEKERWDEQDGKAEQGRSQRKGGGTDGRKEGKTDHKDNRSGKGSESKNRQTVGKGREEKGDRE